PPWVAEAPPGAPHLRDPHDELDLLALPADEWAVETVGTRERATTDPDGNPAVIDDGVILLRRR
ncbi:MAG TPA: SAM-dependent methyltransferase, partial [Actinotalea sp.]|nr:SAM-dependent methyltransferase [Actinotalea sp.]